jgi:adenosylcobyric acid synthase
MGQLLCVFGTGSDVGKSWITAGLCRVAHNAGLDVAPFKAQNMSNNAGVTPAGLEMGRAQIVQAIAAGQVPHVDMNPLLLKPSTDRRAQVVALGRVLETMTARQYFRSDPSERRQLVHGALDRLLARHDLVIAEGAGSCAEVNLRDRDLVNMPIAHHGDGRVLLVADIHRGGVFAQVVGTLACMPDHDRARVAGVLVNRFRGDPTLFEDGVAWLEHQTGVPVVGVVPWTRDIQIEMEDGLPPDMVVDGPPPGDPERFHAAVLRLPRVANFTDFDALTRHGVAVHYLAEPRDLSPYDVVIVPGTKNTRADLEWVRSRGWEGRLQAYGGAILGICGGFQMLGQSIDDPHGVDGAPGASTGLGLLPVRTTMGRTKTTRRARGRLGDVPVHGYEIHVGETQVDAEPLLELDHGRVDGARCGRVMGTYVHGLFDSPGVVEALLGPLRPDLTWPTLLSHAAWRDGQLDALAQHLVDHMDPTALSDLIGCAQT